MRNPRDPRDRATRLLPTGFEARVLEPSPPANLDPDWYADDPTDPAGADTGLVTPIPGEGTTWATASAEDPDLAEFAASNWLDGRRRLRDLPADFDDGRRALHQIAFFAVAPKRFAVNGKLGLRYTKDGFGTPFFRDGEGRDAQVRVAGGELIHQAGATVTSEPITTVGSAARFLGLDYVDVWFDAFHDPLPPIGPDAELKVSAAANDAIGDWFGFATHVLERARRTPGAEEVTRVQLWPEHFDPAFEMGSADAGHRASYGASPGDDAHAEPYLYVAAWGAIDRSDPYWNEAAFNGATLTYRQLVQSEDPYASALTFYEDAYLRLTE